MFCSFKFTLPSQVNLSINSGEKVVPDAYGFSIPSWDIPINFNFTKIIITNIFQQKDHLAQILNNFVIHMTKAILLHYTPEDLFIKSTVNPFVDIILTFFLDHLV